MTGFRESGLNYEPPCVPCALAGGRPVGCASACPTRTHVRHTTSVGGAMSRRPPSRDVAPGEPPVPVHGTQATLEREAHSLHYAAHSLLHTLLYESPSVAFEEAATRQHTLRGHRRQHRRPLEETSPRLLITILRPTRCWRDRFDPAPTST